MTTQSPVPADHPLMVAWTTYQRCNEFANAEKWAANPAHLLGSLWCMFAAGWRMAQPSIDEQSPALRTAPTDREAKIAAAVALAIRDVAELPDRESPEEWPEAMLVTGSELETILTNRLRDCPPAPDGKALRELRDRMRSTAASLPNREHTQEAEFDRGYCEACDNWAAEIDRLLSAAPVADAEVEASREATMLRAAIAKIAAAVGAGVDPQCTVEFLCEVPKEVESVVGKLRAENARLQTDLAAARADQAAMAREQLTAVLGEVVANYETRWDRDIEIRWCPQRWLRTYITTRLAALPQPKPAAEPVPELSVPELSATVNSEIAALTADRDKWKKAASELCPKHIGGHYTTCPVCHGVRMKAERDEAVLAMKRHKLTAALPPLPIDEGREPLATMRLLPAVPGEEIFGVPIEGRPFPNDDLPNRVEPKP